MNEKIDQKIEKLKNKEMNNPGKFDRQISAFEKRKDMINYGLNNAKQDETSSMNWIRDKQ